MKKPVANNLELAQFGGFVVGMVFLFSAVSFLF